MLSFWALLEGAKAPSTSKSRTQISSPINFNHVLHVGFNAETGEFEGLPKEWEQQLQNSNISKKERQENPETIIAVSFKRLFRFLMVLWNGALIARERYMKSTNLKLRLVHGIDVDTIFQLLKFYDEHTDEKQNRDDNKILQPSSNGADLGSKSSSQSIPTTPSPRPPAPEPKRKMTPAQDVKVIEGMSCSLGHFWIRPNLDVF